ncbi:MAG: phosphoglucosamine mutase, partial [Microgenomates group bacterium]
CIHGDIMLTRDGGATFVKMLNILKWSKKSLGELVGELPKFYIRRAKFDCPMEKFQAILTQAKKFQKAKSIDETDGVKLLLDDATWVLFRPSGNAPEFRVFVESNTATKANQLLDHALAFAQKIAA